MYNGYICIRNGYICRYKYICRCRFQYVYVDINTYVE